ncbi:pesticin C-terminus-like muramidase [Thalassobaculum litoreum]|uniref:Toxin homologue of phage lysozyme n=1 Tax=Thalassobaculum litoreum DSM 18839 TaxID=1123362 RepID=A0A8G2BJI5_9PROT|nr:pesticin C-terminus-like muramidase [Thalassobaculum litoreum]SDF83983.1 toxin homologue of phage lysozyme [Thalassobaculum litoreum DSM 18839]
MLPSIDWSFIEPLEGFETTGYVPVSGGAPLGMSGVTIGSGVDLGHWTVEQLRRRRVPQHIIDAVGPYLGIRGWPALQLARDRPLILSPDDARMLTDCIRGDIVDAVKSRYDSAAKAAGSLRWNALPEPCRTVVTSVAFQYGPALSSRTPNFWRQVTDGRWAEAHANLMNFGDAYETRRRKEADHLAPVLVP